MMPDKTKKDAILNELKGVLFEYIVSQRIASYFKIEDSFASDLEPEFFQRLRSYQQNIIRYAPEWATALSILSQKTSDFLLSYFFNEKIIPMKVKLQGKDHLDQFAEGDILIEMANELLFISLKLCKANSYVNTKSAGIKSIISEYFLVNKSGHLQHEFNLKVDYHWQKMSHRLHEEMGIEFEGNYNEWVLRGFSELPGDLNGRCRLILQDYYRSIAQELYLQFKKLFESVPDIFANGVLQLMGMSRYNLIQVFCFHQELQFDTLLKIDMNQLKSELAQMKIDQVVPTVGHFELHFPSFDLQIRPKPMNKFTSKSMKVNCSIRYKN